MAVGANRRSYRQVRRLGSDQVTAWSCPSSSAHHGNEKSHQLVVAFNGRAPVPPKRPSRPVEPALSEVEGAGPPNVSPARKGWDFGLLTNTSAVGAAPANVRASADLVWKGFSTERSPGDLHTTISQKCLASGTQIRLSRFVCAWAPDVSHSLHRLPAPANNASGSKCERPVSKPIQVRISEVRRCLKIL
jgi:hypothetical protein